MTDTSPRRRVVVPQPNIEPSGVFWLGWAAILLATVVLRGVTVGSWSWYEDDLLFIGQVPRTSFLDYLVDADGPHLTLGMHLFTWLMTTYDPLDHTWAALITTVLAGATVVAWGLALRQIFGERLPVLIALVVLGLGPLFTTVSMWWVVAITSYPIVVSMGLCVWFLARHVEHGRRRELLWLAVSFFAGLFFWNKAVLVVVPLVFVALLLEPSGVRAACVALVRRLWPLAVGITVYLLLYASSSAETGTSAGAGLQRQQRTLAGALDTLAQGVFDILLPTLVGGPFEALDKPGVPYQDAPSWLIFLLWAATVVLVGAALAYRRRAVLALAMSGAYALVAYLLLFVTNRYDFAGPDLLHNARYTADVVPVVLLTCLFLLLPTRIGADADAPWRLPVDPEALTWLRHGMTAFLVTVTVLTLVFSGRTWDRMAPNSPKDYFDTLTAEARQVGRADVRNTDVPSAFVSPILLPGSGRLSNVLGPLDLPLRYDAPAATPLVVDEKGRFWEGQITEPAAQATGQQDELGCRARLGQGDVADMVLSAELFAYEWTVDLEYFAGSDATVLASVAGETVELVLAAPRPGEVAHLIFGAEGAIDGLSLAAAEAMDTICVTNVSIGILVPSSRRPAGLGPVS